MYNIFNDKYSVKYKCGNCNYEFIRYYNKAEKAKDSIECPRCACNNSYKSWNNEFIDFISKSAMETFVKDFEDKMPKEKQKRNF